MTMLWVSHFSILRGQLREDGPFTAVYLQEGAEGGPDLYLVVEPALPGSEEFCADVAAVIGESFHRERLSLTGGLLRALRAAHRDLKSWNGRSLREQWVAAGVSALTVRGREAYLAQVGPALAYAFRGRTLRPLQPHIPEAQGPLGLADDIYPAFTRHELAAGDRLLLASSNLAEALSQERLRELMGQRPERGLSLLYRWVREMDWFAAILLVVTDDPAREEGEG
jgi:hypothetical protein